MDEICNEKIDTQTQYTMWLKNTVIPCSKIWNKIAPQYIKTLKDLNASLENETKLLTEKKALTSQLSKCHSAISSFTQKVSDLEDEIKYKNAKISEMQAKTSVLSMLNQSQTAVAKPNFRNLINKFAIVLIFKNYSILPNKFCPFKTIFFAVSYIFINRFNTKTSFIFKIHKNLIDILNFYK